jgi:hypothetical protein
LGFFNYTIPCDQTKARLRIKNKEKYAAVDPPKRRNALTQELAEEIRLKGN